MNFVESIISAICSAALGVVKTFFSKVLSEISTLKDPTTLFDTIFSAENGGAKALDDAIFTIAICLGILFAMYTLIATMTTSNSRAAESPVSVLLRMCIFMPLAIWSQSLCNVFYEVQTIFLDLLHDKQDAIDAAKVFDHITEGIVTSDSDAVGGVIATVISLIFAIMLVVDLFKLVVNIIEQYVMIGILAHLSPLALASGCTRKTNQILSSWINLFCTHLFIFVLDQWSIMVFTTGCKNGLQMSGNTGQEYGLITWIVALDAFLRISSHWEMILGKLGLKAVNEGHGMGSLLASIGAAGTMLRAGSKAAQAGIRMKDGTWSPKEGSLLGATLSKVSAASVQNPGHASEAANGVVQRAYAKSLDSAAERGKQAATADFAAGKTARVLGKPNTPQDSAHNAAYNQAFSALKQQEASRGAEAAKRAYFSGAGMKTFSPAMSAKDAAFQEGYNKEYAKFQAASVGSAMGNTARPAADALQKSGISFSENARNNAVYGISMGSGTRAINVADSIPKETAMPASKMEGISGLAGTHPVCNSTTAPNAVSVKTADRIGSQVVAGASFSGMSGYGTGETLHVSNSGLASYDSKGDIGSIRITGTVQNANGAVVAAYEGTDAAIVKKTPENMSLLNDGNYQAFEVNIGTPDNPDLRMMFPEGTAYVTNAEGEICQDRDGNDIKYTVSAPIELFDKPVNNSFDPADFIAVDDELEEENFDDNHNNIDPFEEEDDYDNVDWNDMYLNHND